MAPREGTVTVNGLRLHYLDWGGEGPAIVLHHATSLHAWVWHPIAQRLVARGRVLAYDARGHGDSDKPASDYGWDRFARDLVGFIEALQLGPATLVGHSSGGTAALACAAWRPELVTRIVALEPVLVPPQVEGRVPGHRQLSEGARRRRTVWPSLEAAARHLRQREAYAHWREDVLRLYLEKGTFRRPDGQVELKMSGELEAQVYEGRPALDIWPLLSSVRCPVLLVMGRSPSPGLDVGIREAARHLPDARLEQMAAGSHFFPQELPEETAGIIEAFLDEA
jgi:pimeloyl-ACP methyl ester carboxylesterase